MEEQKVIVQNSHGIHARPAAMLVETATKFSSSITLVNGPMPADAKSIMGIMMLSAVHGTEITVQADGPDETEAVTAIVDLFNSNFGNDS